MKASTNETSSLDYELVLSETLASTDPENQVLGKLF